MVKAIVLVALLGALAWPMARFAGPLWALGLLVGVSIAAARLADHRPRWPATATMLLMVAILAVMASGWLLGR